MADAKTTLRVQVVADLADIKQGMGLLRGELAKVKAEADKSKGSLLSSASSELKSLLVGAGVVTAAAAGIRAIVANTLEAERAQAQLAAALKSTGGAAGLTVDQLNAMADGLQKVSTYDDEAITGAQSLLLTFTKIGRDVFPAALESVLNMSTALGTDLKSASLQVGKALNDPVAGLNALSRAGIQFTDDQEKMVKKMVKVGDVAGAQKLILRELETQFGGSAKAARNTLGGALQALGNDFDNLLEGDTQGNGMRGATQAVNELGKMMQSDSVRKGFAGMISLLVTLASKAAEAAAAIGGLFEKFRQESLSNVQKSYDGLLDRREELLRIIERGGRASKERDPLKYIFGGADRSVVEKAKRELAEVNALLAAQQAILQGRVPQAPAAAVPPPKLPATAEDEGKPKKSKKAEAVEEIVAGMPDQAAIARAAIGRELKALEDRLQDGLVSIAAFYAQKRSLQEQAIDIEIAEQEAKVNSARSSDEQAEALTRIIILQQERAAIGPSLARDQAAAEAELAAKLRESAAEQERARQEVERSINITRGDVFGEAEQSIGGFFTDLATGAKSFKDAMRDMVLSFVQGLARMAAEVLARRAVLAIASWFSPGPAAVGAGAAGVGGGVLGGISGVVSGNVRHTGGLAGGGGQTRSFAWNPAAAIARMHVGGIAGLGPNEVPAILERDEEVLTRQDRRHRWNGGGRGDRVRVKTPVVAIGDRAVADALASAAGEDIILTHVRNNWGSLSGGV